MMDKIKKFLRDLIQGTFAICVLGVVLYLLSTPHPFSQSQEKDEARADAASYKAELQQEEYDRGFSDGYDQGYHWGFDEGQDYGYDAGYERGYIQCLEDNNMEWKIDKFLDGK